MSKPQPGKKPVPPTAAKVVTPVTEAKAVVTPKPVAGVKAAAPKVGNKAPVSAADMPFGPEHYRLLLIGIGILLFGFVLLASGDFVDATQFSVPLYIAPVVLLAGYGFLIYTTLKKSKSNGTSEN